MRCVPQNTAKSGMMVHHYIPSTERLRQKDSSKFKASLVYTSSSRPSRTRQQDPVSKQLSTVLEKVQQRNYRNGHSIMGMFSL